MDFGESEDDVTLEQIEAFEEAVGKHQAIVASTSYWESKAFPFTTWKSSPATMPFPSSTGRLGTDPTYRSEDLIAFPSTPSSPENGMPISIHGPDRQKPSDARSLWLGDSK